MSDSTNNDSTNDTTDALDDLEVSNDGPPLAAAKKSTTKKAKSKKKSLAKSPMTARIMFGVLLLLIIGYGATFIQLWSTMNDNPRKVITSTFDSRSGFDSFIAGDLLLTPDQQIENLGVIRQRTSDENSANTLEFLTAVSLNNPPDIYRGLINPTVDPSLIESTSIGNLPVISPDGRSSLITYARPFNEDLETAEISILVHGLGISETLALAALRLKPEISLAFSPYTLKLQDLTVEARKAGHEVLLEIPMEPSNYPLRDPGPYALRKNFSTEKNIAQFEWILSRTQGYVGLINYQGDALMKDPSFINVFLPLISRRGLMFVENDGESPIVRQVLEDNNSYYTNFDIQININDDEFSIKEKFQRALLLADSSGRVTIGIKPFPLLLMKLALWVNELPPNEYTLTPISSQAQLHEAQRLGLTG